MIVANGARIHEQDRYEYGDDEAPPGICFTTAHPDLAQEGQRTQDRIYAEQDVGEALFRMER